MQVLSIGKSPNVEFSFTDTESVYTVRLHLFRGITYASIMKDEETIAHSVKCIAGSFLIPDWTESSINIRFETIDGRYPNYEDYGTSCNLVLYTKDEIEEL